MYHFQFVSVYVRYGEVFRVLLDSVNFGCFYRVGVNASILFSSQGVHELPQNSTNRTHPSTVEIVQFLSLIVRVLQ